jgi:4-amino-4-deoxy-L-arabinose transferase-like glycosyltransferase
MTERGIPRRWEAAALLSISLLAAALRFYRLPQVPPGLHYDEGFKGVMARGLLEGSPPQLFFESDMGEEPVAIYLVAAALGLAGSDPWVIRLPSAVIGALTVPLLWWLGRELFPRSQPIWRQRPPSPRAEEVRADAGETSGPVRLQGQVAGLGGALVLSILYWHLSFSRIGMEPILVPFFATLALAALLRGLNTGRWLPFVLAGAALAGSLYTYKAGYLVPFVAVLFVGCAAIAERGLLCRQRRGLLLAALVALVVAAPLGLYFVTHPANFLQRPASVALIEGEGAMASPWLAWIANLPRVLGMFFVRGDANPRSNLPGRPALDPFLAVLFLVGLGWALVGSLRGRWRRALPLVWLGLMVLPTLVTEDAPHFGRAIGATPALALLCALGGWATWQAATRLGRRGASLAVALLLTVGAIFAGASTARAYFHTWAQSPGVFYAYDVGLVEIAGWINAQPADEDVYLTPTAHDHYTLQFLVQRPFASFDGRAGLVFPSPNRAATVLVLLREDEATLPALQRARPDGGITWTLNDGEGQPYAAAYTLPASDVPAPLAEQAADAVFGGVARLEGVSVEPKRVPPGGTVDLTLYWQALAPLDDDYTVFTHLLGSHNPATDGPLWAGHDAQPDGGAYPTTAWQPGQVILDEHRLTLPADAPPGEYRLEAGLYLLATMARLPASDASGRPLADNAVPLGTIEVTK